MKRILITLGAALLAAVPATVGLVGNTSFAQNVPVRVPSQANVLDDHGGLRAPTSADLDDDNGGQGTHAEPGDDRSGANASEPGDDKGGQGTHAEPGDDKSAISATEPGDDKSSISATKPSNTNLSDKDSDKDDNGVHGGTSGATGGKDDDSGHS